MKKVIEKPEPSRIVAIGDLHGKDIWKKIVEHEHMSTREIFIGDYFDSWHESFEEQMQNFKEILQYKRDNPQRVVLLLGNHDYHYLVEGQEYSGYQHAHADAIGEILAEAVKAHEIQIAYEEQGFLFSHAGFTREWCIKHNLLDNTIPFAVAANLLLHSKSFAALNYNRNDLSGTGEAVYQGPLWVRPDALKMNGIEGYRQVVGHSKFHSIVPMKGFPIFIDVLDKVDQYLVIENGNIIVETVV